MAMAVMFIMASGGILFVHTVCACSHMEMASLYTIPEHCSPQLEPENCALEVENECHSNNIACVHANETTANKAHHHHASHSNCESSDFTYYKIQSQFLANDELTELIPGIAILANHFLSTYQNVEEKDEMVIHPHFTTPHILTGRDFVLACRHIKIPHSA